MTDTSSPPIDAQVTAPLTLPAPSDETSDVTTLQVGAASTKLDDLGPMVVNSDGTIPRIANWTEMTETEKQRTLRVLIARNKLRLANEEKKQQQSSSETTGTTADQDAMPLSISTSSGQDHV